MMQVSCYLGWLKARFGRREQGASVVEYALLLSLIAVVCIVAIATLGTNLSDNYDTNTRSLFEP